MNQPSSSKRIDSDTIPALRRKQLVAESAEDSAEIKSVIAAEASEPDQAEPAADLCPRCGEVLVSPNSLGWCIKCGYCRTTAETPAPVFQDPSMAPAEARPSFLGMVEAAGLLRRLPVWFWVWIWGIATVVLVSFLGDLEVAERARERAVWSTTQITVGLFCMIVGQLWAAFVVAPLDDKLGVLDVIVPIRLWASALKRLPAASWPICLASWGLAAILGGFIVVGGLEYWLPKKPEKKAEAPLLAPGAHREIIFPISSNLL
jgi:hypothetical protein